MQQNQTTMKAAKTENTGLLLGDNAGQKGRGTVKSASAFRTISEVADELKVQQHVLRFWESKFSQVKPLKRGGGRRYYRPEDVELLRKIHHLLYQEGYTIKGVQKLLHASKNSMIQRAAETTAAIMGSPAVVESVAPAPVVQKAPPAPAPVAMKPVITPKQREELSGLLAELKAMRKLVKA